MKHKRNPKDYIGKRFGHITIIGGEEYRHRMLYMLGKCDCGKIRYFQIARLLKQTTSCGCMNRQIHGYKKRNEKKRLYNIWCAIKQRCYYKKYYNFDGYGGRGIKMSDEWKGNFKFFLNWAIQNGYKDNLTIERIDVNGDYCPENCRWATAKEQANNKRNTIYYNYNGKKYTLSELSEKYGVSYLKIWKRLKRGWTIDKAILK